MAVLAWAAVVTALVSELEAAREQGSCNMGSIDSHNMGSIGSHNVVDIRNNMGMAPYSNKEQGYILYIPSLKAAELPEQTFSSAPLLV